VMLGNYEAVGWTPDPSYHGQDVATIDKMAAYIENDRRLGKSDEHITTKLRAKTADQLINGYCRGGCKEDWIAEAFRRTSGGLVSAGGIPIGWKILGAVAVLWWVMTRKG